ncbi:DUF202 domain-containing protein [Actinokineospora sp. NBRC 105648]|uniref:DUF202 domain-containing protein n=1 Tax=Actinokineospora sp. NBRC 105648 TaxID=3032206 RepID=UPI0024A17E2E|nr:DUF202 domain-containing protein [Actinokineospora sp. NBRC 105648]GLZ40988.1 hypothetical protein Acsp05_46120 [Actinokineospora sp. NBRC 105648]
MRQLGPQLLDPGLQTERTRLAWSRTALAAGAVGALLVHGARDATGLVCGGLALLCAVGLVLCGTIRYRRAYAGVVPTAMPAWAGLLTVAPAALAVVALLARSR